MAIVNITVSAEVIAPNPITVLNVSSYINQCGAGNDSTVLATSILLSRAVTVDTLFSMGTQYSLSGDCNNSIGADTQILVLAGNDSGDSPDCFSGAPLIEYYASICGTSVWQHDNTVDTITI